MLLFSFFKYCVNSFMCVLTGLCVKAQWRTKFPHCRRRKRSWPKTCCQEQEALSPNSPWLISESFLVFEMEKTDCTHSYTTRKPYIHIFNLSMSLLNYHFIMLNRVKQKEDFLHQSDFHFWSLKHCWREANICFYLCHLIEFISF